MQCFWVVVVSTSQTCVSKLSDDLFIGNNTFKAPLIFQQTFCRDESVRCSCLSWEEIFTPSEVNRFPPHGVNSPMSPGELMNSRKGKKIRRANKQRSVWPQAVRCITDNTTKPNTACLYSTQKSPQLLQRWLIKKDGKQLLSSAVEPQRWSNTEVFDVNSTVSLWKVLGSSLRRATQRCIKTTLNC